MARKKAGKVPVSERALIGRINRKLRDRDPSETEVLRKARGSLAKSQVGEFYVINASRGSLLQAHVDLESFARELGALQPFEELV